MLDYVLEVNESGGWILLPIFATAWVGWWIVLWRGFTLWTLSLPGVREFESMRAGLMEEHISGFSRRESRSVPGRALLAVYEARNLGKQEMENRLDEIMKFAQPELERWLPTLANLASTAPLMGLMGTVSGMVHTFQVIHVFGTGNPSLMAGSISEALMTTQNGLLVAVPLMILHILLRNRSERIEKDSLLLAHRMLRHYSGQQQKAVKG